MAGAPPTSPAATAPETLGAALRPLLPLFAIDVLTSFTVGMVPPLLPLLAAGAIGSSPFSFHLMKVREVYPGSDIAPSAQYVEIQMYFAGQNLVGGKEIRVFDSEGTPAGTFTFPGNVAVGLDQSTILIATPEAQTFFSVAPDMVMMPVLSRLGGKVCFHDPQFGPLVLVGAGGVLVEIMKDRRLALPPLDEARAESLIDRLAIRPLLDGVRGRPPADVDALTRAVVGMSWLAHDLGPHIYGLDANPVICGPDGCVAVDALVIPRRT